MGKVRLNGKETIGLISNIATMLNAGIPIYEVTEVLSEDAKGNTLIILQQLQKDLAAGKSLNVSFAHFPLVFTEVTCSLIKAAEEAGTLEETLKDLVVTLRKEGEFNDKVKSAMTYPIIICLVFVVVVLMMLVVVIPKLAPVFERMNLELPFVTKVMFTASGFLMDNTLLSVLASAGIGTGLFFFYKYNKRMILNVLFAMPVVRKLIREIDITRFTRSLHLLLSSGVPITHALALAQQTVVKKEVASIIENARNLAESGHPFSEGLRTKDRIFPPMMVKLMEVGERTGRLEESMMNVSEQMDYEVSKTLKSVTSLIEPLMLVFIGGGVGGMMMGIISPIYGVIGSVGG